MAWHLVHDDDGAFDRYSDSLGFSSLDFAYTTLARARIRADAAGTLEYERFVAPYLDRIARSLSAVYYYGAASKIREAERSRSLEDRHSANDIWRRVTVLTRDRTLSPEAMIDSLLAMESEWRTYEDLLGMTTFYGHLARFCGDAKLYERQLHYRFLRLDAAVRRQDTKIASQVAGTIGASYNEAGIIDSMLYYYGKVLTFATRSRLPEQAGRYYEFMASYYRDQGKWVLAHSTAKRAVQICREYNGGGLELRFQLYLMNLHASLGGWGVVRSDLENAELMYTDFERIVPPVVSADYRRKLDILRARVQLADGNIEGSRVIYESLDFNEDSRADAVVLCRAMRNRSEGLIDLGQFKEAMMYAQRGLDVARQHQLTELLPALLVLTASGRLAQGDLDSADQLLGRFPEYARMWSEPLLMETLRYDVLRLRVALARKNTTAAIAALGSAFRTLQGHLINIEAGPEGYLFLDDARVLREAGLEILSGRPDASYAFDLIWRGIYRSLGLRARNDTDSPGFDAMAVCRELLIGQLEEPESCLALPSQVRSLIDRTASGNLVHVQYQVGHKLIRRWVVANGKVTLDRLQRPTTELRELAVDLLREISSAEGQSRSLDPDTERTLRELGAQLLPPLAAHLDGKGRGVVLVSADGFLETLPFAILSQSAERYSPVIASYDIVGLRSLGPADIFAPDGGGLVVANPAITGSMRLRYPSLGALPFARKEADLVCRTARDSRCLTGPQATRERVLDLWENASFLYMAGHSVQDPDVPYLQFLPLASSNDSLDATAYLDIQSIRAANFERCSLVVLSNCASGAPYLELDRTSPGIAQAFADGGASAVVYTLWPIADNVAYELMKEFIQDWLVAGDDPVQALCAAQRAAAAGAFSTRGWMAFSVLVDEYP